jgi:hypothetical protein
MDPLMRRIQDSITSGRLPSTQCVATWYGPGHGQRCRACDQRILHSEIGVDCDRSDGTTLMFHATCYRLWHALVSG